MSQPGDSSVAGAAVTKPAAAGGEATWGEVARGDRTARGWSLIVATVCLGVAMVIVPALSLPARGQALTVAGLLLVAASLAGPLARWRGPATLAAVVAVAGSALGRPGTAGLAAEGLLVLGYLLLTDAPAAMPARVAVRWLRLQLPALAWAALASAAVLLVLGIRVPVSAGLVVAGAAAAVGAAVIALPRRSRQPREPR
jgi:hypothetical protein